MTIPITLEEYSKDRSHYDGMIYLILSSFKRADFSGSNATIKDLELQVTTLQRVASSSDAAVVLAEANKLISLIDKTASGSNLNADQRATLSNALALINKVRETPTTKKQERADPATPEYKEAPNTITPERWAENQRTIVDAANQAISLSSSIDDADVKTYAGQVQAALKSKDNATLYAALTRLEAALKRVGSDKAIKAATAISNVAKPLAENQRSNNGKDMEAPPKASETPPKPEPGRGKLCEPITYERWGVRFRFLEKPPEKVGQCESKGGKEQWDMKDWFLQLLPAMQSVIPRQGARDVPNAGPGLSFRFKNNMVKHKIPGGQPVYQMMGVDSAIITFVGTFTGDGGLGYINKVDIENGELAESAKQLLEAEATARRAGQSFPRATRYGGEYPYGGSPVNAMFNPIYHVRNRATYPGGDTSSALVGSNSTGWLIDNSILRSGFFERDGCPGQCPPPSWGGFPNGQIDEAGGKVAWGDFGVWPDGSQYGDIGTRSQMDTHKLAYIAAYLDAYHEMVSFYKFAVQAGKLMEITINLRKSHDGLKPRIADPRMKGKFKSDTPDPLRDMHTGNPTFKGYLRSMSTWAQYSDRVWYAMEFEVVDHGLQGKKAVKLTNEVGAGGGGEEKSGSNGSGNSERGSSDSSSSSNSGSGSKGSTASSQGPAFKELSGKFPKEDVELKLKDGRVATLYRNGVIKDKEGNYLSYSEAKDMLNFIDPFGHSTLNNWYDSVRVLAYPDGGLGLLNTDGSIVALSPDGKVTQGSAVGKGGSGEVNLNKVNIDGINYSLNFKIDPTQRAAVDEWKAKYGATKTDPIPTTTPAPSPPTTTPTPIPSKGPFNNTPFVAPSN